MRRIKLLIFCLAFFSVASAQEGYFGKRFYADLDGFGSLPLFQNIFAGKGYQLRNGELQKSYNLADFGGRFAIGIITRQNQGFALEYGYRRFSINPLKDGELNRQYHGADGNVIQEYIYPKAAFMGLEEHTYAVKTVFVSDDSHLPAGFSNELGIGYSETVVRDKTPAVEYPSGTGQYSAESISANMVDPNVRKLPGMVFTYGFRMNYPVTKGLLFHVGFRYGYSMLFGKKEYREKDLSESWLSEREMWSRINQRRQLGIISFSTGLTLCF